MKFYTFLSKLKRETGPLNYLSNFQNLYKFKLLAVLHVVYSKVIGISGGSVLCTPVLV